MKWIFRLFLAMIIVGMTMLVLLASYSLSAQDGSASSSTSETVTNVIGKVVEKAADASPQLAVYINKAKTWIEQKSPYGSDWNANVRKLAHFSIYFLIATLLYLVFSVLKLPMGLRWILAIVACFIVAVMDEMHQGEIAGRVMSGMDVFIDTAGAACASTIWYISSKVSRWMNS